MLFMSNQVFPSCSLTLWGQSSESHTEVFMLRETRRTEVACGERHGTVWRVCVCVSVSSSDLLLFVVVSLLFSRTCWTATGPAYEKFWSRRTSWSLNIQWPTSWLFSRSGTATPRDSARSCGTGAYLSSWWRWERGWTVRTPSSAAFAVEFAVAGMKMWRDTRLEMAGNSAQTRLCVNSARSNK